MLSYTLAILYTKNWWEEEWTKDWCRAVFVLLPDKGNLKECLNYRSIRFISLDGKLAAYHNQQDEG